MMHDKTLTDIVNNHSCTGCGTCVFLCPNNAIKLSRDDKRGVYTPNIQIQKCTSCGMCLKVCPNTQTDLKNLTLKIFGTLPNNLKIGNCISSYLAYSTNHNIRYNSSSGGIITQLLIFALEKGLIDGAIVTRMNKNKPLEPETFIARTSQDILTASKSKYCPVPANLIIKSILDSPADEKYAFVGLPCHINGIRKAELNNRELRQKIIFHLGLFCDHTVSFLGQEFLLKKLRVKRDQIEQINYRGNGWPGNLVVKLKNGSSIIDVKKYLGVLLFKPKFFAPHCCLMCTDALSEHSDISFGDPWLPELKNEKIGKSLVISRTILGETLLREALTEKKVVLDDVSISKVLQSASHPLNFKKKTSKAVMITYKYFYKNLNLSNYITFHPSLLDFLMAPLFSLNVFFSTKRSFWPIISALTEIEWFLGKIKRRI